MTPRWRLALVLLAFAVLAPAAWHVVAALPPFGHPTARYGEVVNALLPGMRHASNMVAAVNFDVRGIDTLGEEAMLLGAVTGAVVLLRGARGEAPGGGAARLPGRAVAPRADATVLVCRIAAAATLVFGLYVVLHGTTTPGGGFQGGVIVAASFVLVYLGEGYAAWRRVVRGPAMALLEGGGLLLFVAVAALPLALGQSALANILPPGEWHDLRSGGTMVVANLAVGLAVAGSFGLLLLEFLEETRAPADGEPE